MSLRNVDPPSAYFIAIYLAEGTSPLNWQDHPQTDAKYASSSSGGATEAGGQGIARHASTRRTGVPSVVLASCIAWRAITSPSPAGCCGFVASTSRR